jgi:DNA-directed RNA polymerase subunit omega
MARITVEDCIDKFDSRFELVLVASNRARKLHSGENPTVEKDNDKPTVIALREIAEDSLSIESLKDKLVEEYQTVSRLDEEELALDYTDAETEMEDEKISEDEHLLNKEHDGINSSKEHQSNESEDSNSSTLKNDEYNDISDDMSNDNNLKN